MQIRSFSNPSVLPARRRGIGEIRNNIHPCTSPEQRSHHHGGEHKPYAVHVPLPGHPPRLLLHGDADHGGPYAASGRVGVRVPGPYPRRVPLRATQPPLYAGQHSHTHNRRIKGRSVIFHYLSFLLLAF